MKIALSFPGCHHRGGVERVLVECANGLAARGHEVHVFASSVDPEVLSPSVSTHSVVVGAGPGLLRTARFASRSEAMIRTEGPFDAMGTFGVVCPIGGVMWVQSVHARWLEVSRQTRSLVPRIKQLVNPFHPFIRGRERHHFGRRNYRRLIALTPEVASDLVRLHGVPVGDIDVLANGYSPTEFDPTRREAVRPDLRARLGYSDDHKVIVFVANETERKGLLPLLEAVALLNDPSLRVLAVGRLDPRESQSTIDRLKLEGRVQFTGPSSQVAQYYHAAEVFCLPTKYEAWGLVIVEALGCGIPVVTSRLAGASVAVREGMNGYLLEDPKDPREIAGKLREALTGRLDTRESIAASVERWKWSSVLDEYERILLTAHGHTPSPQFTHTSAK